MQVLKKSLSLSLSTFILNSRMIDMQHVCKSLIFATAQCRRLRYIILELNTSNIYSIHASMTSQNQKVHGGVCMYLKLSSSKHATLHRVLYGARSPTSSSSSSSSSSASSSHWMLIKHWSLMAFARKNNRTTNLLINKNKNTSKVMSHVINIYTPRNQKKYPSIHL